MAAWLPSDFDVSHHPVLGGIQRVPLEISLVPETAGFSNLRSIVRRAEWKAIAQKTYVAANYRCQVCFGQGPRHPVECHEFWHYDDDLRIQSLTRTVALCPTCHRVVHYGHARRIKMDKKAKAQLIRVKGLTDQQAEQYIEEAFQICSRRSQYQWRLDATSILDFVDLSEKTRLDIKQYAESENPPARQQEKLSERRKKRPSVDCRPRLANTDTSADKAQSHFSETVLPEAQEPEKLAHTISDSLSDWSTVSLHVSPTQTKSQNHRYSSDYRAYTAPNRRTTPRYKKRTHQKNLVWLAAMVSGYLLVLCGRLIKFLFQHIVSSRYAKSEFAPPCFDVPGSWRMDQVVRDTVQKFFQLAQAGDHGRSLQPVYLDYIRSEADEGNEGVLPLVFLWNGNERTGKCNLSVNRKLIAELLDQLVMPKSDPLFIEVRDTIIKVLRQVSLDSVKTRCSQLGVPVSAAFDLNRTHR